MALALHTPWISHTPWLWLCTLHGFRTLPVAFALHTPWVPYPSHGFCSAHSMGSAHFPRLLLCTLHGPRTLPMAFAVNTPSVPYTSTMAWLAHSMGSEHFHCLYCVIPRRRITKIASPFYHSPVQEAQRHVKPLPHDSGCKCEPVGRQSA